MGMVPKLVKVHEKYAAQGLAIVAVSNEAKGTLDAFAKSKSVNYRVGVDTTGDVWKAYPGRGVPRAWLIGPDGKIVFQGHPGSITDAMIEEQIKKIAAMKLRDVEPALAPAKSDFDKKSYGAAYAKAAKVLKDGKAEEKAKADAQYLSDKVKERGDGALATVDELVAAQKYADAMKRLAALQQQFKGSDWEKQAKEKEKALKGNPAVKREQEAQSALEMAMKMEASAKRGRDKKKTIPGYDAIIKKYAGTQAAADAEKRIEALGELDD